MPTTLPLPPPPEPPPLPPPPPPPTVVVTVPPDPPVVVNVPAPEHGVADWLYSNAATLAGVIAALVAAWVAYRAIQRQIRSASADAADQIEANNVAVTAQIEESRKARRRDERRAVAIEVYDAANDFLRRLGHGTPIHATPEQEEELERARRDDWVTVKRLTLQMQLLDMDGAAKAFSTFWQHAKMYLRAERIMHRGPAYGELEADHAAVLEAVKAALDE